MRTTAGWRRAAVLVAVLAAACAAPDPGVGVATSESSESAIRVGAFNFPESRLLAELYAQALAGADFAVDDVAQLGSREIVEPALEQGRIDVVPEYAGSAVVFLARTRSAANADIDQTHAALVAEFKHRGVTVANPAPAQNQNAVVVTAKTAQRLGLRAILDLREWAKDLVIGGPPECPQREACLPGLKDTYGLEFERFLSLQQTDHVATALNTGEIDVGVLFTTDPEILVNDFVVLDDNRNLQPAENVVPVVRTAVVDRHGPRLVAVLDEVSQRLNTRDLAQLNRTVEEDGIPVHEAAASWLQDRGVTP